MPMYTYYVVFTSRVIQKYCDLDLKVDELFF